ncbi:four helix bundle protein [Candidatus Omnitrophota bacterium]
MYNFEKLTVWQKAMDFCGLIYKESRKFPKEEIFGLTSQLRRAATSIPLNLAEGSGCSSKKEFSRFVNIALRSQYETVTIIKLCKRLNILTNDNYPKISIAVDEIAKLLHGLANSLKTKN